MFVLLHDIDQRASLAELHHYVIVTLVVVDLVELDDVGVIQGAQQLKFSQKASLIPFLHSFSSFQNFYSTYFLGAFADDPENLSISALSDTLLEFIVILDVFSLGSDKTS